MPTIAERLETATAQLEAQVSPLSTAVTTCTTKATNAAASASNAATSASNALTSANAASVSAAQAALIAAGLNYKGLLAGGSVPATSTNAGDVYLISSAGTSQSKTWGSNDLAIYTGTSGSWDQVPFSVWSAISAPHLASKAPSPGIVSAGSGPIASHPPGKIDVGTGSFTVGVRVLVPDTTPSTTFYLLSNAGTGTPVASSFRIGITATAPAGRVIVSLRDDVSGSAVSHYSSAPIPVSDNSAFDLVIVFDRGSHTVQPYCDGTALGTPIDISAFAGKGFTSASDLLWFAQATNTVGTLFDGWIVAGALSASRIADIHRAGSIAPLCTWTLNATTGGNIATIDGLSFLTWPDFGRADPINNPIAYDRSGNNQHAILGTSGLTAAVPLTWRNTAPSNALVSDGSNGTFVRATLNSQNPGTGEATLPVSLVYPQDATSAVRTIAALTSSTTTTAQARSLVLAYNSTTGVLVYLYGATTSDYRRWESLALHNQLTALGARGIACALVVRRSASGLSILLGIGGDTTRFYDVTNLFSLTTTGTPPAITDEIDGDYLVTFYHTSTSSSATTLHHLALLNFAPSEAELRSAYARGWNVQEWRGASKANHNTFTNAWGYGANDSSSGGTVGGGFAVMTVSVQSGQRTGGSGSYFVRGTDNSAGAQLFTSNLPTGLPVVAGQKVRVSMWLRCSNPSRSISRIALFTTNAGAALTSTAVNPGWQLTDDWVRYTIDLRIVTTGTVSVIKLDKNAWSGSETLDVDDIEMEIVGVTTLDPINAAGLTALNAAKSATNDSSDFLLSTSGVTVQPDNRRQIIRPGTLTFTSPDTLNLQLFGSSVVDTSKKWRIVSMSGTSNGSANLSLGSASTGEQYVSAQAVTSGDFDIGTFVTRRVSGANLWVKSSATVTITDLVVILEQIN